MTKFTIEDLIDIAYRGSYDDLERELALQLLASMEQTPAYLRPFGDDGETFVACDGNDERAIALYAVPQLPQPAVPDIATVETTYPDVQTNWQDAKMYAEGWNACRAAMLQAGNSPVIPDGWKLVPIDPTKDMLRAGQSVVGFWLNTVHCYSKMLAAAPAVPQQEVKSALEHGMRRYAGAMQKLSEGDD